MLNIVQDVEVACGVRREHVELSVSGGLAPLAVVLEHHLERHAVHWKAMDELLLVEANRVDPPGWQPAAMPDSAQSSSASLSSVKEAYFTLPVCLLRLSTIAASCCCALCSVPACVGRKAGGSSIVCDCGMTSSSLSLNPSSPREANVFADGGMAVLRSRTALRCGGGDETAGALGCVVLTAVLTAAVAALAAGG